jgi:hypothetical protein
MAKKKKNQIEDDELDDELDDDFDDDLDEDLDIDIDDDDMDDDFEDGDDDEDGEDEESEEENVDEMAEIESKLQKGEDIANIPDSNTSMLPKSRTIYACPLTKKIFYKNKWIKDTVTDLYTVRTELAVSDQMLERAKKIGFFIGSIEVYDKDLEETKDEIINLAQTVEAELENKMPFDVIIDINEVNGILYIFTNTTRLAVEIAKRLRQERGGAIQYEWFERNQYVRAKWFSEVQNREYFRNRIRAAKERRIGMFNFEEE